MKKILSMLLILLVIIAGLFFWLKGKDTYDASRYSASLSHGLNIGSTINYTLPDQFDKSQTLDESIQTLILVFGKGTAHIVKEYLDAQPADYLTTHKAAFVADISPMPVVIRNTFALPDLKSQHYGVNLIYDKSIAEAFKKDLPADSIVIVTLNKKIVEKVNPIKNTEALKAALQ